MERRGLQRVLGILCLISLLGVAIGVSRGVAFFLPGEAQIPVSLDNQFRYLSGVYVCVTLSIWWTLPKVESRLAPLRLVAAGVFLGGVGRCLSMLRLGAPPEATMA